MNVQRKIDYSELFEILSEYNSKFNLTAITTYEDFLIKHIEDSKLALKYVGGNVLDIGSGAGFPALVLINENPKIKLTMTDSVGKKVNYLNFIIQKFGLENAEAVHTRIEDFDRKEYYDTVTARAVAKLNVLAEYALPFLKKDGLFIAYKSNNCDEEIEESKNALKILGGTIEKIEEIPLTADITRKLILIRKTKKTDDAYPRKGNKPRSNPL